MSSKIRALLIVACSVFGQIINEVAVLATEEASTERLVTWVPVGLGVGHYAAA